MKRGRRGASPKVKAAKAGKFRQPDRRDRSKKKKQLQLSPEERALMLEGLGEGEVPAFLLTGEADFSLELEVWKDQAPTLRRMNALVKIDRYSLAIYCVHMADWIRATLDIRKNGATYTARSTITKDKLHKLNPMVRVRQLAESAIMDLATRFGLDPTSRFKLAGIQAGLAGQGMLPGMFDEDGKAAPAAGSAPAAAAAEAEDEDDTPTAFLKRNSTPPPRPN